MSKIILLPLDSRPCCYTFPAELADVDVPPIRMMDFYREPSDYNAISSWLKEHCSNASEAVLSVDQLVYGGLISSRQLLVTEAEALRRLELVRDLKKSNPRLRIYLFSVIMRSTVSTLDAESRIWWESVTEYSHLFYLSQIRPDKDILEQLEDITSRVPRKVLETFLDVRRRNARINQAVLELLSSDIASEAVLLQEDCTPESIQTIEQKELLRIIRNNSLSDRVYLHNGTDECAGELCTKVQNCGDRIEIELAILGSGCDFTARYEDRKFSNNMESHLKLMNMEVVENSPVRLFILTPRTYQFDYCPAIYNEADDYSISEYIEFAKLIASGISSGKKCYLLDLSYANGGNIKFMKLLAAQIPLNSLCGYSGWNTSSNSLGTILAQMASDYALHHCNKEFLAERLLDDLFYQAEIRAEVQDMIQKRGDDIWNIKHIEECNGLLKECFEKHRSEIEECFGGRLCFDASFRWPRIFEVDIQIGKEA